MKLEKIIEEGIENYFYYNPVLATQQGNHHYDHLLARYDKDSIASQISFLESYQQKLKEIKIEELPIRERVDYKIFNSFLNTKLRTLIDLKLVKKLPVIYIYSFLYGLYLLIARDYLPQEERLENIKNRLVEVNRVLREGKMNLVDPPATFIKVAQEIGQSGLVFLKFVIPPLFEKYDQRLEVDRLIEQASESLQNFLSYLNTLPTSKDEFAVGREIFRKILLEDHFIYYTPEELLSWGETVLNDTRVQLEQLCNSFESGISPQEIFEKLRDDHPSTDSLLKEYREETSRARDFVLKKDLVDFPKYESLIIEETPLFARTILPYAGYVSPPLLQKNQTGRFWVTPTENKGLKAHYRKSIPITVVHEAYPGHHIQLTSSGAHESLIRKVSYSPLFSEGWAFYCEELMDNMGYLSDPVFRLIRLKDQLWRAARLIIDIKLHTQEMIVEEGINFLIEKAYLERNEAEAEVKRFTFNPTQPLSYLTGKREIISLLNDYKIKKGDNFNLKDFHNKLLSLGTIAPAMARQELFS